MASTKTGSTLETLETKLRETAEAYREMERLQTKLSRLKRGSERYLDMLPDISVAATVLSAKCESLEKITDEISDARPED
jgi:hypothetical protein